MTDTHWSLLKWVELQHDKTPHRPPWSVKRRERRLLVGNSEKRKWWSRWKFELNLKREEGTQTELRSSSESFYVRLPPTTRDSSNMTNTCCLSQIDKTQQHKTDTSTSSQWRLAFIPRVFRVLWFWFIFPGLFPSSFVLMSSLRHVCQSGKQSATEHTTYKHNKWGGVITSCMNEACKHNWQNK